MKSFILFTLVFLILTGCERDINVTIKKETGGIVGYVYPASLTVNVKLYQDALVDSTQSDSEGLFKFLDLDAGDYQLVFQAEGYSKRERWVHVPEGQIQSLGEMQLAKFPYPMAGFNPEDGEIDVPITPRFASCVYFRYEIIEIDTNYSVAVSPELTNKRIELAYRKIIIHGDYHFSTEYTITLDTSITFSNDAKLEYEYSFSFETEPLKVIDIIPSEELEGQRYIRIKTNSNFNLDEIIPFIAVDSEAPVIITVGSSYSRYLSSKIGNVIYLNPELSWCPDTVLNITVLSGMYDSLGDTLNADFTAQVKTAELIVNYHNPYDQQHYVENDAVIQIRFNYILDESNLESELSIDPATDFTISTSRLSGNSRVILHPDTLMANTYYTVNVSTGVRGYYGGSLKEPFSFSFKTQ